MQARLRGHWDCLLEDDERAYIDVLRRSTQDKRIEKIEVGSWKLE